MAMSPRLLRPRATVHPEAAMWASRVISNGGSVPGRTLSAVSKFCASIDSAGIRGRFYRLNLFCGTGLNACLVPLYRGPSLGGTQYGNATDTNTGPFVSGDYAETGASGGLTNQINQQKYLSTGIQPHASGSAITAYGHLSVWAMTYPSSRVSVLGCRKNFTGAAYANLQLDGANNAFGGWSQSTPLGQVPIGGGPPRFIVMTRRSDNKDYACANGSVIASVSSTASEATTADFAVFRESTEAGGSAGNAAVRLAGYSVGAEISDSQNAALYTIWRDFQNALQRNV